MAKPDVSIPDSEPPADLVIDDIVVGDGDEATAGAAVEVHYVGVAWSNGEQFDASWDRGDTFSFHLGAGQVIEGWDTGVHGHAGRWPAPPDAAPAPRLRAAGRRWGHRPERDAGLRRRPRGRELRSRAASRK